MAGATVRVQLPTGKRLWVARLTATQSEVAAGGVGLGDCRCRQPRRRGARCARRYARNAPVFCRRASLLPTRAPRRRLPIGAVTGRTVLCGSRLWVAVKRTIPIIRISGFGLRHSLPASPQALRQPAAWLLGGGVRASSGGSRRLSVARPARWPPAGRWSPRPPWVSVL